MTATAVEYLAGARDCGLAERLVALGLTVQEPGLPAVAVMCGRTHGEDSAQGRAGRFPARPARSREIHRDRLSGLSASGASPRRGSRGLPCIRADRHRRRSFPVGHGAGEQSRPGHREPRCGCSPFRHGSSNACACPFSGRRHTRSHAVPRSHTQRHLRAAEFHQPVVCVRPLNSTDRILAPPPAARQTARHPYCHRG